MSEPKQRTPEQQAKADAHTAWIKQCEERNNWINEANTEWRNRVAARRTAIAAWDTHIEQARQEFQRRKATARPDRPG